MSGNVVEMNPQALPPDPGATPCEFIDSYPRKQGERVTQRIIPDIEPNAFRVARAVFGDDFLSPADMISICGVNISPDQIRHLIHTLPATDILLRLASEGYAMVPLLSVRDRNLPHRLFEWQFLK